MEEQTVEHTSDAAAAVNDAPPVVLYDDAGRTLTVPFADQAVWIARGFRLNKLDAKAAIADLPALWQAAYGALQDAVKGIDADGVLDANEASAYFTAIMGLRELNTGIAAVLDGLHAAPVKQEQE